MTFCDSHLHLTREDLSKLSEWHSVGLAGATSATAQYAEWAEALELTQRTPSWVRFALGIHPWYLEEAPETALEELDTLLVSHPTLAIGEIGLDFADGRNDRERQLYWFETQFALASKHHRPAVLHLRRAWDVAPAILVKYPEITIVLHSFNGSREVARQLLEVLPNCYFSFGFALANPAATRQAYSSQLIPIQRLVIDSDYPFQHLPDKPSSTPADLAAILSRLAELRHESPALLAAQIAENWQRVFRGK